MEVRKSLAALPGDGPVNGEVARGQLGSEAWKRYMGVDEETQASLLQEVWARGRGSHSEHEGQERTRESF